jgi:PAC2 family
MQPLRWERRPDGLRAPALVCAFKGWNDAGESATSALAFVAGSLGAEQFATIDPEEFVDFQSTRPMVRLVDGVTRAVDWPDFDPGLIQRLSLTPPTYEGPTGIVGVLHAAFEDAGMPSASLWAAVPHYVAVAPNPKGALALLRRLESLVGVTVDATDLEDAAIEYESQVSKAVELDPDVQAFVERLERAADEESGRPDPGSLPSGDVLAREFQRFLRQRGDT